MVDLLGAVDSSFEHAAIISTVNLVELHQKLGASLPGSLIGGAGSIIASVNFSARQAADAGALYEKTMTVGLSLADCACLTLAAELQLGAVTADRAWADIDVGVDVEVIR